MKLKSFLTSGKNLQRLLSRLGQANDVQARAPARGPPYFASQVLRRRFAQHTTQLDMLFATRSRFAITPVVLWGPDVLALQPNPEEAAIVYRVRIADLYRPDVPILSRIEESEASVLALPLVGTHVYTPTAAILYQFREVALEGRATRVHHFEQPVFAWE